ncbi:hypothetical protein PoB_007458900 [Plakobranchus ocellatus]|uniref:Uncharacterized protein n=1 Tax=Plakobranchus ocellatus TaxID=259542 RepID=A0AAV4DV12_9GAST|nr:hypothetical protein PoB_007458900 [Plakobranchus ocellatus]
MRFLSLTFHILSCLGSDLTLSTRKKLWRVGKVPPWTPLHPEYGPFFTDRPRVAIRREISDQACQHLFYGASLRVLGMTHQKDVAPDIQQLLAVRDKLQIEKQYLLRENPIVLPIALRRSLIAKTHKDHPGIVRMKRNLCQSY